MRPAAFLCLVLLSACTSIAPSGAPISGQWGGSHIGLTLDASGGRLEYDCAAGTIGPVIPASDGTFAAEGTHTPGTGGPEIEGQSRPTFPAAYSGRASGDRMTLQGRLSNGVELGPFELRRGAEPGIFRCL